MAGPLSLVKDRHYGCLVEQNPTLHGRKTAASPRLKGAEEDVKQRKAYTEWQPSIIRAGKQMEDSMGARKLANSRAN